MIINVNAASVANNQEILVVILDRRALPSPRLVSFTCHVVSLFSSVFFSVILGKPYLELEILQSYRGWSFQQTERESEREELLKP